ncbi:FecCD family ABC transporter permease [Aestuariivirga sp.]|uniref:FecCD family ABC transporter permease n=1 Tax=Aestuariivirga sp. TaxID=2650926 RepID=UPI0039E65A55
MTGSLTLRQSLRHPASRGHAAKWVLACLTLAFAATAVLSISMGAVPIALGEVLASLSGHGSTRDDLIVWAIRLPRTALAASVGAALALSGTLMQGLFRNPLADPGLTGVSAGAALAAVTVIVAGQQVFGTVAMAWLPLAAFLGGLAVTLTLYATATQGGRTSVTTMLLAGIALGAISGAATGLLIFMASDQQLREFTFWTLGSLAGATWQKVALLAAAVTLSFPVWTRLARGLDQLALGEAQAAFAGLSVERLKRVAIVITALLTGVSVAVSGMIGFVGLVVPHVLRLCFGPSHGLLLPAAALLGAILLILADTLARTVAAPTELPIGIITACLGGPVFLWMLLRDRRLQRG